MRRVLVALALLGGTAAADPARVLTAPTAWLPRAGEGTTTLGTDHRGHAEVHASYGLGGFAEAELGADRDAAGTTLGRAGVRVGVSHPGHDLPGLVLGVRTTFGADDRVSDAYAVASADLGVIRLHGGADAISFAGPARHAARLRPLAGLEIHPPMYPRSSLLGDLAWQPHVIGAGVGQADDGKLSWLLGIGVRYQALPWASVELAVRARQAAALGDSTVLLRVNASWPAIRRKPR